MDRRCPPALGRRSDPTTVRAFGQPVALVPHELRIHHRAVPRHVDRIRTTKVEHPLQRAGPGGYVGTGVDRRVGRFLDEVSAEQNGALRLLRWRDHDDQVVVGVTAARVFDVNQPATQVQLGVQHPVIRRPHRCDRPVEFGRVGTVFEGVGANLPDLRGQCFADGGCGMQFCVAETR